MYAVRPPAAAATLLLPSVLLPSLLLLAGCGGAGEGDSAAAQSSSSPGTAPVEERTLTVFAAASLQRPFEEIGRAFERSHEGVTVRFSFGGSSGLVAQLSDGAPADVLATADEATMDRAVADDLVEGEPRPFASNTLQIAVPGDNPANISSLADLTRPGVKVVLCAPVVPCGAASIKVEQDAGIDIKPVSEEQSVTDVLGKVRSGEADAGLVYVTDVIRARGIGGSTGRSAGGSSSDAVKGIDVPESASTVNTYPIGTLEGATDVPLADEFVAMVAGTEGLEILAEAGFAAP